MDLPTLLADAADELPTYLVVFGLDRPGPRELPVDRLRALLRDGPPAGRHLLGWWRAVPPFAALFEPAGEVDKLAAVAVLDVPVAQLTPVFGRPVRVAGAPRPGGALGRPGRAGHASWCRSPTRPADRVARAEGVEVESERDGDRAGAAAGRCGGPGTPRRAAVEPGAAWTEYLAAARQLDGVRRGAAAAAGEQARSAEAAREELTVVRTGLASQQERLRELGVPAISLVPSPPELTEAARSMAGGPAAVLAALRAARGLGRGGGRGAGRAPPVPAGVLAARGRATSWCTGRSRCWCR